LWSVGVASVDCVVVDYFDFDDLLGWQSAVGVVVILDV